MHRFRYGHYCSCGDSVHSGQACTGQVFFNWFSDLVTLNFAHKPPVRTTACPHSGRRGQTVAGDSYTLLRAISAQATLAILFANATATSIFGLRASIHPSHDSSSLTCLAVCRTTAIAPSWMRHSTMHKQ